MSASPTLLVAGGSGHLARQVIEDLLRRGGHRLVTTTRTPERLRDLSERGVDVRHADYDRPETLANAFAGADRVLLVSTEAIGARSGQIAAAAGAAQAAGVRHILYTSSLSPRPGRDDVVADDHFWSEQAIIATGIPWTMLRHGMYAQHIPMTLAIGVATGTLVSTIGDNGRAYVTREDCARADAAALASDDGECRILDVTGPELVTHEMLATIAAELTGRPVAYRPASPRDAVAAWIEGGIDPFIAEAIAQYDRLAAQGGHAAVTPVVSDLTGRAPEGVRSFLARHVAALMPGPDGRAVIDWHLDGKRA